jgi:hypothetical protein
VLELPAGGAARWALAEGQALRLPGCNA